jgi:hypothetical protein
MYISHIFNIFATKKWEITLLNYFHEYAILLHANFSVLTVDRTSPMTHFRYIFEFIFE